jgi:hypothetical protein
MSERAPSDRTSRCMLGHLASGTIPFGSFGGGGGPSVTRLAELPPGQACYANGPASGRLWGCWRHSLSGPRPVSGHLVRVRQNRAERRSEGLAAVATGRSRQVISRLRLARDKTRLVGFPQKVRVYLPFDVDDLPKRGGWGVVLPRDTGPRRARTSAGRQGGSKACVRLSHWRRRRHQGGKAI